MRKVFVVVVVVVVVLFNFVLTKQNKTIARKFLLMFEKPNKKSTKELATTVVILRCKIISPCIQIYIHTYIQSHIYKNIHI